MPADPKTTTAHSQECAVVLCARRRFGLADDRFDFPAQTFNGDQGHSEKRDGAPAVWHCLPIGLKACPFLESVVIFVGNTFRPEL